ncbi:MAG: response regulator, partial [Kiritimatiellae bacterium]|nr:response regulator [Kiritimatiellia bacterium]
EHAIEVMMKRGSCDPYEKEYLLEDGRRVSALIVGVLLRREPVMGLAFALDISDRKAAEEARLVMERQVQHTQKLESLGVLAGGIAHDFNNLLTAILGHTELALDALSPMAPGRENLHEIEKVTCRAAELAKQMLAYSGKGRFVIEPIDLGILIEQMGHLLEVAISKRVDVKYRLAPDLPLFQGDSTQVRQIIMNLITNASEAIGDHEGMIALSTGSMYCERAFLDEAVQALHTSNDDQLPEGTYVYFEVKDSGTGMNSTTMAKIFDPFFTTKFTGRGLGMSAVLGIIRGHRGFIRIHSEVGRGSTLGVYFPAGCLSGGAAVAVGATPSASDWRGEGLVLLADDEEYVRDVGRQMLERMGFAVLPATDGREAVELYEKRGSEISCVLLDLTMPRLSGYEAFCALRRINPNVPVFLASGYSEQTVVDRFAGKGLDGFIQKPFSFSVLRDKLAGCRALTRHPAGE